jgi:flagellar P-ring protein precursor FlgI
MGSRALMTESATFGLEACKTCYPFSRTRTRARARQYDDDYEHEHGFAPLGVADAMIKTLCCVYGMLVLITSTAPVEAARIKDISSIAGVRDNQLIGYGLIVGLNGTGDGNTEFTTQTISSMLRSLGITVDPDDVRVRNVAAVMATATLRPFARPGSRTDVLVSSLGDAKSLQGGTLLLTPLRAPNGEIYAVAQGAVSIGGFAAGGQAGGGVQKNHPTVGHIAGGALIEREVPIHFNSKENVRLSLHTPDFTTSFRLAQTINGQLGEAVAQAVDSGTIEVQVPSAYRGRLVEFVSALENMDVTPDSVAKVVLDERTGTVVIGENVRISTVAVAHGNLSIEIKENKQVSQPAPLSRGQTVVTPDSDVKVTEEKSQLILLPQAVTIRDLVRALNSIGVTPRDLIAIFQAIKAAGALQATLEIM